MLPKLSKKLCYKWPGASYNQKHFNADCLQSFPLLFMSLLTAKFAENSNF